MEQDLGRSVLGEPIWAFSFREPSVSPVLVLAGVHGDEPKGVTVVTRLADVLSAEPAQPEARVGWILVPVVNPDGYASRKRRNANRVDINRNFPTRNWEPGSKRSRMFGGETPARPRRVDSSTKAMRMLRRGYPRARSVPISRVLSTLSVLEMRRLIRRLSGTTVARM